MKRKNIKKSKAFSLLELLFVMIILGILISFAIKQNEDAKQSAVYTSLRNDAHNALNSINFFLSSMPDNVNYDNVSGKYEDTNEDGIADTGGINNDGKLGNNKIVFSHGNVLELKFKKCNNNMIMPVMKVYNTIDLNHDPKYAKIAYYNGCISGKIKLLTKDEIDQIENNN
jgi:prepilin-type N-terminal cleavage/methylation domain-containing protein